MHVHVEWFPKTAGPAGPIDCPGDTVLDVLKRLEAAPDGVLVVRDGTPIPLDAVLRDGDRLRIVRTVSGG